MDTEQPASDNVTLITSDPPPVPTQPLDNPVPKPDSKQGAKLLFGKHGRPIVIQPDVTPPSHTLYLRNLPEKMGHTTLRRHVMRAFETFGWLLDVKTSKTLYMRGQAWVTFKRLEDAKVAYREMQDHQFFGKQLIVLYAKTINKTVAKYQGKLDEYRIEHAKRVEERAKELAERKAKKAAVTTNPIPPTAMPSMPFPAPPTGTPSIPNVAPGGFAPPPGMPPLPTGFALPPMMLPLPPGLHPMPSVSQMPPTGGVGMMTRAPAPNVGAPGSGAIAAASAMANVPDELVPANPNLYVSNLPKGISSEAIRELFASYEGLVEVRLVPGRDIAFVEYENDQYASTAKNALHDTAFPGTDVIMRVVFRK